jgi:phosphoglycolate phosphatase
MIRAVVFDKDGTLFDFQRTWSQWTADLLAILAGADAQMAALLGRSVGFDLATLRFEPDSPVIAATPPDIARALLPHLPGRGLEELVDQMNALAAQARQAEVVPLRPLLEGLRDGGITLGLATNDGEAPARAHLSAAGIADLFDFVAGCDSGYGAKPAPGQLAAFVAHSGIPAAASVMVGDSVHDLHAGRAAGMRTVGVLTGLASGATLSPHADCVLPDIGGLPGWIAAQAAMAGTRG